MALGSKLGPRATRYFRSKRDPMAAFTEDLLTLSETAQEQAKKKVDEVIGSEQKRILDTLHSAEKKALEIIGKLGKEALEELKKVIRAKVDSLPAIKGDPGYTPKKGVDYHDGEDGDPGEAGDHGDTPEAGVDYPTIEQFEDRMSDIVAHVMHEMEMAGMTKTQIIEQLKKPDAAAIARAIEALPLKDRLDYWNGLKNQPSRNAAEGAKHTLHRGGSSKQTYYYDLSDLCDGATRIFNVPANTRIVDVKNTDAPSGIMRPLVDWTGSGSTVLTLSSNLAAPTQGATLYILYVV